MNPTEKVIHDLAIEFSSLRYRHYSTCKASLEGLVRMALQQYQANIERDFQQAKDALKDRKK